MTAATHLSAPTYCIGIDPAAAAFVATALAGLKAPVTETTSFDNSAEGFAAFQRWLTQHKLTSNTTLVCIENTGVYSEALCYALDKAGFRLCLIDPKSINKALPRKHVKTDPLDSRRIAEYGLRYVDQLRLWQPHEAIVEQIRVLLTTREQLVGQKTAAKNARAALHHKVIQTPAANAALETTIAHLKAQIKALESAIRALINEHPRLTQMVALVTSAPGVGLLLAAHLVVLTSGFGTPVSYRKLAAYLGIAPGEYTSGKSVYRPASSRGYGPSMVRKLLHLAARSLKTHNAAYRQYYARKLAEGKQAKVILNNIANKLLKTLCAMIKNKTPYIEGYRSVNPMLSSP